MHKTSMLIWVGDMKYFELIFLWKKVLRYFYWTKFAYNKNSFKHILRFEGPYCCFCIVNSWKYYFCNIMEFFPSLSLSLSLSTAIYFNKQAIKFRITYLHCQASVLLTMYKSKFIDFLRWWLNWMQVNNFKFSKTSLKKDEICNTTAVINSSNVYTWVLDKLDVWIR